MKRWWHSLFPPPLSGAEAEVRAHAIGAFWGLAVVAVLILAGMVVLVLLATGL